MQSVGTDDSFASQKELCPRFCRKQYQHLSGKVGHWRWSDFVDGVGPDYHVSTGASAYTGKVYDALIMTIRSWILNGSQRLSPDPVRPR